VEINWTLRQNDVISLVMDLTCIATGLRMTKTRKLSNMTIESVNANKQPEQVS